MRSWLIQLVAVLMVCGTAYAQQCLHDNNETTPQKQRRVDAVNAVRRINTAQAQNMAEAKRFVPFTELINSAAWKRLNSRGELKLSDGAIGLLPGFELRLTTDGTTYSLSLTDKSDPCLFTLYSNDVGIIYTGYPIDYEVTPSRH